MYVVGRRLRFFFLVLFLQPRQLRKLVEWMICSGGVMIKWVESALAGEIQPYGIMLRLVMLTYLCNINKEQC